MRNLIFILLMISGITLRGQVDTLIHPSDDIRNYDLQEVVVSSCDKIYDNRIPRIPRKPRKNLVSLSETLNNYSIISLKNAGPGSLSTVSLRGHSASQTDISLDGFSIQSNMNGVYDLSLIPFYFLEQVSVSATSNSSDVTGSIGGNLQLNTDEKRHYRSPLKLEYVNSSGSYKDIGNYFSISGKWGNNRKQYSTFKTFYRSSKNNFPYENLNVIGTPTIKLKNGDFNQFGFQQNNYFELKNNNFISTKFWYVDNHRKVPPTLTQSNNSAFQNDELINGIISWKKDWSEKYKTELSSRYMNEHIYYDSPGIESDSRAQKYETRAKLDYNIKKNNYLSTTIGHEYSLADADGYAAGKPSENRTYALASYNFENDVIATGIQLKEEFIENELSPILASVHGKYNIKDFSISSKISKNYRRPTFNDLYWNSNPSEGGNPNLTPEKGWKEELSFNYQAFKNRKHFIKTTFNLFNSNIKNWILWSPDDTGKWVPQNVKEVWSRGLETNMNYRFHISSNLVFKFRFRYNFIKTTNTKVFNNSENTLGKQLIYAPLHSGNIRMDIRFKRLRFKYNQVIAGKRFITTDNSSFIPKYTVSNIQLSHVFRKKKIEIEPAFEIRNLFNKKYQIVANRPLPPIHFQGIIYFKFNK